MKVGRLAPTPSGALHLGNLTAFLAAWLSVRQAGGRLLLRVEDIDQTRARREVEAALREDLTWLGLTWDEEVPRQSERSYQELLDRLRPRTYRCICHRVDLARSGGVYPGTCRDRGHTAGSLRFRLDPHPRTFLDLRHGWVTARAEDYGDPILLQRDGTPTYNLAVVADDLRDGVTEVARGGDLLEYTTVQIQLWEALGATPPAYLHAPLILGPDGTKLAKRHGSTSIRELRELGCSSRELLDLALSWLGQGPAPLHLAAQEFRPAEGLVDRIQLDAPAPPWVGWRPLTARSGR